MPKPCLHLVLFLLVGFLNALLAGEATRLATDNVAQIKIGYLTSFTRYVKWPEAMTSESMKSWHLGILGDDPFSSSLGHSIPPKSEGGKAIFIHRAQKLSELPSCHIVFINLSNPAERKYALRHLSKQAVLTVSDDNEFLANGGIIRFNTADRLTMEINLAQANAVSLQIPTSMLELASKVIRATPPAKAH